MNPMQDATLDEEGLAWLVRVQSDRATADDWAELTAWLETSEDHVEAFDRAERLSAEIEDNVASIAAGIKPASSVVLPFARRAKSPAPSRAPWAAAVGMAAAAAILTVVATPALKRSYHGRPTVYRTAVGETRDLALADGSHVRMDGASSMTVWLGWRTRTIDLAQAQVSFDVAKDPRRPFVVEVGDQQVRVVGTEFNIRREEGTVAVTVRRGTVEVRQPSLGTSATVRLTAGDELRHVEGATTSSATRVNADAAFAWTAGRMVCDREPLSRIVAELNRRYSIPIRVGKAAGAKQFSGVLELGDQAVLVRRLADYLSLTVRRTDREIALS
jgi:transmembrane sensor